MEGMNKKPDMVSHPPHYQSKAGLEVINVIEAFTSDLVGIEATDTGNIIKYICRWKHKNGLEDLKKAKWYLEHLINIVENENTAKKLAEQRVMTESSDTYIQCEYESTPLHAYGDTECYLGEGFVMCKGHRNCNKYSPIKNNSKL